MRFLRNLFRSDAPLTADREPGRTVNSSIAPEQTVAGDAAVEYTDGSNSYSYSETEEDVRATSTPKLAIVTSSVPDVSNSNTNSGQQRRGRPAIVPPTSATAVAPEINAESILHRPRNLPRIPVVANGGAGSSAVAASGRDSIEGSESSHYNLRPRRSRGVGPSSSKDTDTREAMTAGSVSQRDTKRASIKATHAESSKPVDPLALAALPHAASARTTSGVLGNPGKVSTADVNRATLSTLRYLCGELGIPATGAKSEVKERVLNTIKGVAYDGEEVQPLSTAGKSFQTKPSDGDVGAKSGAASGGRRDTITTTAGTSRTEQITPSNKPLSDGIAEMSSKPGSSVAPRNSNPLGSTAELSSTALSKFDSANVKRQQLRGGERVRLPPYKDKADSGTINNGGTTDEQTRLTPSTRAVTAGLPTSGGSAAMHGVPLSAQTPNRRGGRPPTSHHNVHGSSERGVAPRMSNAMGDRRRNSVQANASEIADRMRRASGQAHEHTPEGGDGILPRGITTPATATHLEGVRLHPVGRNGLRVADVPRGIDRLSPAGRKLPSAFAGAEGGPPNPTVSANEPETLTPRNNRLGHGVGQRDTAAASTGNRPTNTRPTPRASQAPAPTLAPLRPIPKRGSMNGFATAGDIVRTFNRYTPRSRPSSSSMDRGGVATTQPSPLFQQGSRPSTEQFPSNNVHRIAGSAFGVAISPYRQQVNKRQSLRAVPLANSQPSPVSGGFNRKRHSTGMASGPYGARAGLLNDLRQGRQQTPSSLSEIRAREKWREDSGKCVVLASSAKKILAAMEKTALENRVLVRGRKPLVPLGPPPSLKRARDDDNEQPSGKRSRTSGFDSSRELFTPTSSKEPVTPSTLPRGLSPRVSFGKRANLTPRTSGTATKKDSVKRSTPQTAERRDRVGSMSRSETVAGSVDRKRRLGPSRPDAGKRASKRRSLSSAAFDAIKDDLNEKLKEKDQENREKKPKGVTFAETVDISKPPALTRTAPLATVPVTDSISAPVELRESSVPTEKPFVFNKTEYASATQPKELKFNVRKVDEGVEPEKKAPENPFSPANDSPVAVPAITEVETLSSDEQASNPVLREAEKKNLVVRDSEPKKNTLSVTLAQPALSEPAKPPSYISEPLATATSDVKPTVVPANDEPKVALAPEAREPEKDAQNESVKPSVLTPKINPLTGGPSYASTPAKSSDPEPPSSAAPSVAVSGSVTFAAIPAKEASVPSFGAPATSGAASGSVPAFTSSAASSAATSSTARKLPFGTNASSSLGLFGTQAATEQDNGSSASAVAVTSLPFGSSSGAAQSTVSFGAPASGSAPSQFGISTAAGASTAFGASSAASSSAGFGASSAPSFGFSAPSFSAPSTAPFSSSSTAPSTTFGAPFAKSTPQTNAQNSLGPFGSGTNSFGNSSATFGASNASSFPASTLFGQAQTSAPKSGDPFSSFSAGANQSGNPFSSFGGAPAPADGPFGNIPTSFNPSAVPTKPFDFSAVIPASSSSFGGSTNQNAFGANTGGGFGSGNMGGFGNPTPTSNPFNNANSANTFGQGNAGFGVQQQHSGGFGAQSGGFGQPQSAPAFGGFGQTPSGPSAGFGQPQQQQDGFSNAQNILFGGNQQNTQFNMGASAPQSSAQQRRPRKLRARRTTRR